MQTNDIVSKYFIGQYYQTLCQDFKNMHKFYASDCTLSISVDKNVLLQLFLLISSLQRVCLALIRLLLYLKNVVFKKVLSILIMVIWTMLLLKMVSIIVFYSLLFRRYDHSCKWSDESCRSEGTTICSSFHACKDWWMLCY